MWIHTFFFAKEIDICYNVCGDKMEKILEKIYSYPLEEIMGDRFGRYSKSIIQDRALPDARDGLKPVQRRIIYGMYVDRNTHDHGYRKCAKTVGNVMGNYHPHGDSSIYEAMVRMSQWWKQNCCPVDMQGNNGSMDGDGAAAMRYTEARLSKIASEMVRDIKKNTVDMAPTFDDTDLEPTVLPCKFPNLLVNGANGISAGYATNIPPHNLGEIIDATIKRIDSPNCRLDTILDIVKGPDFPTGAIVEGKQGIIDAFTTGRGKVIVRAKYHIEEEKKVNRIVIDEIPFDVNKMGIVKKIDEIRLDKKIDGILEVREESTDMIRIAIDIKKDANQELILAYLFKNTDLQISYNYNMVAIVNHRPMTLGIIPLLDAYIKHQLEVVTRSTKFDLEVAKSRLHIVEGFLKMISILDEVIRVIRSSKNKSDAEKNLVDTFGFTPLQAEAIVKLQLYRLTNTDVVALEEESKNLHLIIKGLEAILENPDKLRSVIKEDLRRIKKEYGVERKTEIRDEITEIKIDTTQMIPKEDVVVVITNEGYVKRVSKRSYQANSEETMLKAGDYVIGKYEMNTMDTVLLFTNLGNYLYVPVYEIPDLKWKELGKHISNIIKIRAEEKIIASIPVYDFTKQEYITTFTKNGMVKRTLLADYQVQRYSKPMTSIKLKADDEVIAVTMSTHKEIFIATYHGYGLWYDIEEVPITGVKASGVKAISLKDDYVVSAGLFNQDCEYVTVITEKNTAKRVKLTEFDKTTRARRGVQLVRDVKTNPYYIKTVFVVPNKQLLQIVSEDEIRTLKITEFPIADRYSTGSVIKEKMNVICLDAPLQNVTDFEVKEEVSMEKETVSLKEIDEKILTIDDFLDEFEQK